MANEEGKYFPCEYLPKDVTNGGEVITPVGLEDRLTRIFQYKFSNPKGSTYDIPVFVYGPPGVGKTEIVYSTAEKLGIPRDNVKVMIASTVDPTELRGIPYPNKQQKVAEWFPERFWEEGERGKRIFFFDELNAAPRDVQFAFYRLILEGKLQDIDISDAVRIGAGNRREDVPTLQAMTTPMTTRFQIYSVVPTKSNILTWKTGWIKWAKEHNINEKIIGFIDQSPEMLYCLSPKEDYKARATPRSWERVSKLLKIGLDTKDDLVGSLGLEPANNFIQYLQNWEQRKNIKIFEREYSPQ